MTTVYERMWGPEGRKTIVNFFRIYQELPSNILELNNAQIDDSVQKELQEPLQSVDQVDSQKR